MMRLKDEAVGSFSRRPSRHAANTFSLQSAIENAHKMTASFELIHFVTSQGQRHKQRDGKEARGGEFGGGGVCVCAREREKHYSWCFSS